MLVLFLSLARKKKIPKRKGTVCTSGATPEVCRAEGQELATLKQPAFPDAKATPPLHAPPIRPGLRFCKLRVESGEWSYGSRKHCEV